jgi:folate-dependent tRNA-U54 methylase TrmFO/GidA
MPLFLCAQSPVTEEQAAEKLTSIQTAGAVNLFDAAAPFAWLDAIFGCDINLRFCLIPYVF